MQDIFSVGLKYIDLILLVGDIPHSSLQLTQSHVSSPSNTTVSSAAASARAVLVDMEPKVISHTISTAAKSGRWKYGDQSSFCQKQGSGNNWANGYEL